jgi:hypothetical protein
MAGDVEAPGSDRPCAAYQSRINLSSSLNPRSGGKSLNVLGKEWLAALDDFRNWLIREAA